MNRDNVTISDNGAGVVGRLLAETAAQVDEQLPRYLPAVSESAAHIIEAMRHSLPGGKRLRPLVVMQAAQTFGLAPESVLPTACGFELLHTATLIHDDLPAIDNSPLRRGRASCHVAFDEATAVLAGDALLIAAFGALAAQGDVADIPARAVLRVIAEFSAFTGAGGVIGGEAADIRGESRAPDRALLEYIHLNKTAKLFEAAARAGAILAEAADEQIELIGRYGRTLGLLFQVTDDVLDVTSTTERLGKPAGLDEQAGKQTYPVLIGLDGAREYAVKLAAQTRALAGRLPANRELWRGLVALTLERQA